MGDVLTYTLALRRAMGTLAAENAVFVGQGVGYDGQRMFRTFDDVPHAQLLEFPVAESTQLGYCTGFALAGFLPVCVYPRMDFLLLAMDQLVNHLDKWEAMGGGSPKVIIRTAVGDQKPSFSAGLQHTQDYTYPLMQILTNIDVYTPWDAASVLPCYESAMKSRRSCIMIERMALYD